jgi:hypothetical protein
MGHRHACESGAPGADRPARTVLGVSISARARDVDGRDEDGSQGSTSWAASGRPGRRPLGVVGAMVVVALALDGLVVVWAAATFLDAHCGEDIAWLGLVVAGAVGSLVAFVAVSGLGWWWWRGRPPRHARQAACTLITAMGACVVLSTVAALWFPDGSCP